MRILLYPRVYPANFEPKFFVSPLTDEYGGRSYISCLTFGEAIDKASLDASKAAGGGVDDDDDAGADYRLLQ